MAIRLESRIDEELKDDFIDNCPVHPNVAKSISLASLPSNTTLILQLMDQGVIWSLKSNFRKNLVLKMINHIDSNENNSSVKILDSWNKVSQRTIHNCFKHAGFM